MNNKKSILIKFTKCIYMSYDFKIFTQENKTNSTRKPIDYNFKFYVTIVQYVNKCSKWSMF